MREAPRSAAMTRTSSRIATQLRHRVVAQKPAGMTLSMHLCRGNFKSTWAAQGGYEPVAEALLSEMNVDAYFLEYDDQLAVTSSRCASCRREDCRARLITTKLGSLEDKMRSNAASMRPRNTRRSSSCVVAAMWVLEHGACMTLPSSNRQKLRLVIEIAREVWGEA